MPPLRLFTATLLAGSICGGAVPAQTLDLPPRSPSSPTGSEILPRIVGLSVQDREALLWDEINSGNVPGFLRTLVPITVSQSVGGRIRRVTLHVAPDYFAVGSDTDFFRMPLTPVLAQYVADRTGTVLPTRKIVDDVWQRAPVKLAPFPFSPAVYNILSPALFYSHHLQIEKQRAGQPLGLITAGIKKDVVASALVAANPTRVVIYGWHQLSGTPIQPLSKVHVNFYADYSHGIRLIDDSVTVDGVNTTVQAVLADPVLHPLLSDEGPITSPRYVVPPPPETLPYIDRFPSSGPQLASWRPKFTPPVIRSLPAPSPGGDGFVLEVRDPAGGTDSVRLGRATTGDCVVQADIYCDYRPGLAGDGFERAGIFVRDNAQGAFEGTLSQRGACYALAWDSGDGRLWCMRASGGTLLDLAAQPLYLPSTAWRRFRIEARGPRLAFFVDGVQALAVTDATFPAGEFGIGHHEFFATNANVRGTLADNWFADATDALALSLQGGAPSELIVGVRGGVPGDYYFTPVTLTPGAFPGGWFYGIDASVGYLGALLASGHPAFVGVFDQSGRAQHSVFGVPAGASVYGVTIDLFRALPPVSVSVPRSFRFP